MNLIIEDLNLVLNAEDKAWCDNLFKRYSDLQNVVLEIFVDAKRMLWEYEDAGKDTNNPFIKELDTIRSYVKEISDSMEKNSISLINKIEVYFREKYKLNFEALLNVDPYQGGSLMSSYDAVIANMINQTGKVFNKD